MSAANHAADDDLDLLIDSDLEEELSQEDVRFMIEDSKRLRAEYEHLKVELHQEQRRNQDQEALSRQLEENKKRLQREIAELEITRRKLMAEKLFWDFLASLPDFDQWADFFNKSRTRGS
jgi:hypothetical protein